MEIRRIDGSSPQRSGEVTKAVRAGLLERLRVREGLLERRDVARSELRADPDAGQLRELLVEWHLGEQQPGALGRRPLGVLPGATRLGHAPRATLLRWSGW